MTSISLLPKAATTPRASSETFHEHPLLSGPALTAETMRWRGRAEDVEMARTVLVVDDDPAVLQVLAAMLEELGCDVVTARSGPEALWIDWQEIGR